MFFVYSPDCWCGNKNWPKCLCFLLITGILYKLDVICLKFNSEC